MEANRHARVRVSAVIPTHNRGRTVGRAVESALAQTHRDVEVLVVDDGSTDDTAARLAAWRHPRLRSLRRPHAGVSATRNAGVAAASGDLIAFLDSDDTWKPDKLERDVDFLRRYPEVDAVFSDLEKHDGEVFVPSFLRESPVFSPRLAGAAHPDGLVLSRREMYLYLLQEAFVKPSALTLRREAFLRTGGFDESWSSSEDWEFLLRFARQASLGCLDRPLVVLRISADSLHRVDQVRGETNMLGLLARERARLRGDREALAAVQRGLHERVKQFAWYYERSGRPAAAAVYLRGFRLTRDPELLVRTAGVWVPRRVRHGVAQWLRRAGRGAGVATGPATLGLLAPGHPPRRGGLG